MSDSQTDSMPVALMQQRPGVNFLEHSPFTRVDRSPIAGNDPIIVAEVVVGHLVVRGQPDVVSHAIRHVLELEVPLTPLSSSQNDHHCMRWVSPDEWLLTVPENDTYRIESELRSEIDGHVAIVNVSGGQTIVNIQGKHAIDVLMKSTSYDVHESNFPQGKVVTTTFAQMQVLMRRLDHASFELVVRRSFADYFWAWLRDTSAEFGLNQ